MRGKNIIVRAINKNVSIVLEILFVTEKKLFVDRLDSVKDVTYREEVNRIYAQYTCKNAPFFSPASEELMCTNGKIEPSCECGRCPNLPQTSQDKNGVATISYEQKPPNRGVSCTLKSLHPFGTVAEIECKNYPFFFLDKFQEFGM